MKQLKTTLNYIFFSMLSTFSMSLYILADTFFIAYGVGPTGIAALNVVLPVYNLLFAISLMIGIGSATLYSLHKEHHPAIFSSSIRIATYIGIAFTLAGAFFSKEIVLLLQGNDAIIPYASTYVRILLYYAIFFMLNNVLTPFVRNDHNPKLASFAMVVASFSNIILDYILIIHLNLGMAGAAIATGISPIISLAILYRHRFFKQRTVTMVKQPLQKYPLSLVSQGGIGALIIELSSGITIIAINTYLFALSDESSVAIYGIIANVSLVIIGLFVGIGQGIQPIISRLHRDQRHREKTQSLLLALAIALLIASLLNLAHSLFPNILSSVFLSSNPELANQLAEAAQLYFPSFVFAGINIVIVSYFQAMLLSKPGILITMLRGAIGTLLILPIAAHFFGLQGIFLTVTLVESVAFILSAILIKLHLKKI